MYYKFRTETHYDVQINKVNFSAAGFDALMGSLTISATYEAVSPNRVSIKYEQSTMVSAQSIA